MEEKQKLSIEYLDELEKDYNEQKEITVKIKKASGDVDTTLSIDKYFSPIKIKTCVKELFQKIDYAKQYIDDDDDKTKDVFQLWLMLLLVRHFTTLEIPYEFKKQLSVLEKLSENNILIQIFSSFETSEITKVMEELDKVTHLLQVKLEAYEPAIKQAEENTNTMKKK